MRSRSPLLFLSWFLLMPACGSGGGEGAADARPAPDSPRGEVCTPSAFLGCEEGDALFCNEAGNGVATEDCGGFGCDQDEERCNQCNADTVECHGDTLVTCSAGGTIASSVSCAAGCKDADEEEEEPAACFALVPRFLGERDTVCAEEAPNLNLNVAAEEVFVVNTSTASPSDPATCDFFVSQDDGPEICLLVRASVAIAAGGRVMTTGGARPISIVAIESMTVDGILDVSASGTASGPGATTAGAGANAAVAGEGGGGGGHGGAGAPGGTASNAPGASGGAGGTGYGEELEVLQGGSPGARGRGTVGNTLGGLGGGGGGALHLVSCATATFGSSALLNAGGGGGSGGDGDALQAVGGSGGGSGGAIVIEALAVTFAGAGLAKGGGGGGGGAQAVTTPPAEPPAGQPGTDGGAPNDDEVHDGDPATGGLAGVNNAGDGGHGGAAAAPQEGQGADETDHGSGGGGGAAGRVLLRALPGTPPVTTGALFSPAPAIGEIDRR